MAGPYIFDSDSRIKFDVKSNSKHIDEKLAPRPRWRSLIGDFLSRDLRERERENDPEYDANNAETQDIHTTLARFWDEMGRLAQWPSDISYEVLQMCGESQDWLKKYALGELMLCCFGLDSSLEGQRMLLRYLSTVVDTEGTSIVNQNEQAESDTYR